MNDEVVSIQLMGSDADKRDFFVRSEMIGTVEIDHCAGYTQNGRRRGVMIQPLIE